MQLTFRVPKLTSSLLAVAAAILATGCASAQAVPDQGFQAIVATAARDSRAGAILAVSGCGMDEVVTAGVAERVTGLPMPSNEALRIGSVGKLYVAAVVHQLAREGLLDLDRPVSDQLPPDTLAGIAGADATPRQLLTHTGGVPDYYTDQAIATLDWTQPLTVSRVLDVVRGLPAQALPGQTYRYSNTGWHILALAAETATGTTLGAMIQQRMLEPLELSATRYNTAHPGGTIHGYGLPGNPAADTYRYAENTGADSGITAPAREVGLFLRALFLPDGVLASVGEAMTENPVERDGPRRLAGAGAEINIGSSDLRLVGHTGDVAGYLTFAFAAPALDTTLVGHINADEPSALSGMLRSTVNLVQARCAAWQAASPSR